jgi:hypothetical protein
VNATEITALARSEQVGVTFIHIGKTGGKTVDQALKKVGLKYKRLHRRRVKPSDEVSTRHVFVVIRDPSARLISAYKWAKHRDVVTGRLATSDFYSCFPTLDELGKRCLDKNTTCAKVLERDMNSSARLHVGMGHKFYLEDVDLGILGKRLHILRTEKLQNDFDRALSDVLGRCVHVKLGNLHGHYDQRNEHLAEEYEVNIRQFLREEYEFYDYVKKFARGQEVVCGDDEHVISRPHTFKPLLLSLDKDTE